MERFTIIQPQTLLAPFVKHYWILETDNALHNPQRVVANGCIQLIFHRNGSITSLRDNAVQPKAFISGQFIGYSDLVSVENVNMISVVFHPYGARAFFTMPMNEMNGKELSISDISDPLLAKLGDRILNTSNNNTCIRYIELFLLKRLTPFKAYNYKRMVAAIAAISTQQQMGIAELSDSANLSYKQFKRVFAEYIGANPKEYLRIVRFQRALYILQIQPQINLAQLAYECGYYDQPHLINEFKLFSGYTPSEYLANCAPYSDYFS